MLQEKEAAQPVYFPGGGHLTSCAVHPYDSTLFTPCQASHEADAAFSVSGDMTDSDALALYHERVRGAVERAGLVNESISARLNERAYNVTIKASGMSVQRAGHFLAGTPPPVSERGEIREFSRKSRARFLDILCRVPWSDVQALFITLTYDQDWPSDGAGIKDHLRCFVQRVERAYQPYRGMLWRLELIERKSGARKGERAPHFHMVLFFEHGFSDRGLHHFRQWVSLAWHEVLQGYTVRQEHLQAGTCCDRVTSGRGCGRLINYLLKYLAKPETMPEDTTGMGRFWGKRGAVEQVIIAHLSMDTGSYCAFLDRVREYGRAVGSWYLANITERWQGWRTMGEWYKFFDWLEGIEYYVKGEGWSFWRSAPYAGNACEGGG